MAQSCDRKDRRGAGAPEALAFLGGLDPDAALVAEAVERRARCEARRSSPSRAAAIMSQACLTDAFDDALLCFESYRDGKHPEGKQAPRSLARYCSRWAVTRAMMRYLPASGARQTIVDGVPVTVLGDAQPARASQRQPRRESPALEAALHRLEPLDRAVVRRRVYDGDSFALIARDLGVSRQRVARIFERAVATLRRLLGPLPSQ